MIAPVIRLQVPDMIHVPDATEWASDPRSTQLACIIPRLLLQEIAVFRMCLARKPAYPDCVARRKIAIYVIH